MTTIKKYWWIAAILAMLCVFGFKQCQINRLKDANQLQAVELSTLSDSVKIVVSRNGDLTAKVNSVQVESDNRKKTLEAAGFEIKDLRARDIKWRDINFALQAQLAAAGSGTTILRDTIWQNSVDTIHASVFAWNNKFLFLNGKIVEKKLDFNYQYKTSIDLISEKKGKNYIVSAYLGDPSAVVTTANSITIVSKKQWWNKWYVYGAAGLAGGYFIFK